MIIYIFFFEKFDLFFCWVRKNIQMIEEYIYIYCVLVLGIIIINLDIGDIYLLSYLQLNKFSWSR